MVNNSESKTASYGLPQSLNKMIDDRDVINS